MVSVTSISLRRLSHTCIRIVTQRIPESALPCILIGRACRKLDLHLDWAHRIVSVIMGNNPSTSQKQPAGHSPHIGTGSISTHERERDAVDRSRNNEPSTRREPKRRESIHAHAPTTALPKATAVPPSASLTSVVAQPTSISSTSTSPSQPRNISRSSHSRKRSSTIGTPHIQPQDAVVNKAMGNDHSKPSSREGSRTRSLRSNEQPPAIQTSTSGPTQAADVPRVQESNIPFEPSPIDPTAPPAEAYNLPPASFSRPPRLPLPIEEEVHTPGSPILSPTEDLDEPEIEDERRGSVISSTIDDEEEPDEFQGYMPETGANVPKVPTIVEWRNATPQRQGVCDGHVYRLAAQVQTALEVCPV